MNGAIAANMGRVAFVLVLASCAGSYAFISPTSLLPASRSAISALSIIFGLSTAVTSLLSSQSFGDRLSNDPHLAERLQEAIESDDGRSLARMKLLHLLALLSIMLGLVFLVAANDAPCTIATKLIAFGFAFGASCSLLSTLFLPNLLTSLIRRNARLQRTTNGNSKLN